MSPQVLVMKKNTAIEKKCITLLKEKGFSVTAQRKLILNLLLSEHGPFSAEDIFKRLPKNSCDQATIYRCINQFIETQIVTTAYLEKEMAYFEFNDPHHHHHHIICKVCKNIDTFQDCIMDKIETNLLKKGYKNINHRLELSAVCPSCQ